MRFSLVLGAVCLAGAVSAQQASDVVVPEAAGAGAFAGLTEAASAALAEKEAGRPVRAEDWMIAAANPLAVEAGAEVLRKGGTAADALVAVQTVLGLVEPQSSGLGGGAFLVWYDATSGELTTLDGRETAPLDATPRLFQDENGEPLGFFDAVVGGLSVGTPGTPALMAEAQERWGKLDWAELLQPATRMAEEGFAVSPRLAMLVAEDAERLTSSQATADYFMPGGTAIAAGDLLRNPDYAATLRLLAEGGADAFYAGDMARDIVAAVQGASNPGVLSEMDLAIYRVKERPAVCASYRGHEVCGMGPPSSGAVAVGQILGLLEGYDLSGGPQDAEVRRLIGDASRLAFADRGRYLADADFVPVPVTGLLDTGYLSERAKLLEGKGALEEVKAGEPAFDHALLRADGQAIELPSTSHISIVDGFGNVASMTTTIENGFGSRLMVRGFLLNNELTDFSFASHEDGVPIANRVEPGKRPRSSMAPTIVMKDGAPVMAVGSPGGSQIIGYVAGAIIAALDWDMDAQQAVAAPHAVNRFGPYDLEEGTALAGMEQALIDMGFEVGIKAMTSGLHMITIGDGLKGGADPRREGIALGE
jgi:gamma-glutamyltranspeptidase / glutathione hydrolase